MIFLNKPYITGKELGCMSTAFANRHLSGNGPFTALCHTFFKETYGFEKCLLTTSCTDALEMCAILLNIQPGDEVIMPSFTFVSTANAFMLRGARIVLADCASDNPNIDAGKIEPLITAKTKAIVVVHYAGIACDMDAITQLAHKHSVYVIEDAAQAIDSYYTDTSGKPKPLGSFGHLAAFSFHESKNIQCGEGGLLVINDEAFASRAEIIWEKGTNRASFFRGEVDKYNWVDIGSSFLPSEVTAAFLFAQLQQLKPIQSARKDKWQQYFELLYPLQQKGKLQLPCNPLYATGNAHIFYVVCESVTVRQQLIRFLNENGVQAMFHYPGLHTSPFYKERNGELPVLSNTEKFSDGLVRLPLYHELGQHEIEFICNLVNKFYTN